MKYTGWEAIDKDESKKIVVLSSSLNPFQSSSSAQHAQFLMFAEKDFNLQASCSFQEQILWTDVHTKFQEVVGEGERSSLASFSAAVWCSD